MMLISVFESKQFDRQEFFVYLISYSLLEENACQLAYDENSLHKIGLEKCCSKN